MTALTGNLQDTRDVITSFLTRCQIPYTRQPYDYEFEAATRAEGDRLGYSMEGPQSIEGPYIRLGVTMATTSYGHLPDMRGRILVCLYAAYVLYADDAFSKDVSAVSEFNERFICRQPQKDKVLDDLADLLVRLPEYFGRIPANIVVSSALDFITALLLEHETQGMTLDPHAKNWPEFSRRMSGTGEACVVWIFPVDVPLRAYAQGIRDMVIFINSGNDLLSFYKEEDAGEDDNQVSLIAKSRNISKKEALRLVEDEVVTAYDNVVHILAPHEPALRAFKQFCKGYIAFHSSVKRYRLHELNL
ncbi:hypothetical protein PLICRDRAFT_295925 [Plicaturopsis crispa FD-325 SS-3]|nr:hypothetical protein PLICRDRAFT_295925 [Plicaturopsis crispa FD-325 SS-3]